MTEDLRLIHHDGFDELRFNRPAELNTLTISVIRSLDRALIGVEARKPRCLLMTAEGKSFIAGGDLKYLAKAGEYAKDEARIVIEALNCAMLRLVSLPCPTVIAVQGAVAGAGLSLVLACDLAIGAASARFVYAYDKIAVTPDGGLTWMLPRAIGMRRAMRVAMSGAPVEAREALDLGILSAVVPANELQDAGEAAAQKLASGPTKAFVATRRLMHEGQGRSFPVQLEAECDSFCAQTETEDFRGAVEAFFARRQPEYQGK